MVRLALGKLLRCLLDADLRRWESGVGRGLSGKRRRGSGLQARERAVEPGRAGTSTAEAGAQESGEGGPPSGCRAPLGTHLGVGDTRALRSVLEVWRGSGANFYLRSLY